MREDCRRDYERLSEYLDGELDPDTCREMERHFCECPECRKCVESMKKTIQLCKEAATEEVPVEARKRLRSMLQACFGHSHAEERPSLTRGG